MTTASRPARRSRGRQPTRSGVFSLPADKGMARLPFSLKILLENLLRFEDGVNVTREDIEALLELGRDRRAQPRDRLHAGARAHAGLHRRARASSTSPRCATRCSRLGGDPERINPLAPAELVIDHSVQVDEYGTADCARATTAASSSSATASATRSCAGARRRSATSRSCRPSTGIVPPGQPRVPGAASCSPRTRTARRAPIPDTLVGTDSHTTMINGLGVLGWGVGGIEAEAAMLGQPVSMLIPQVIGFRLTGAAARRAPPRPTSC